MKQSEWTFQIDARNGDDLELSFDDGGSAPFLAKRSNWNLTSNGKVLYDSRSARAVSRRLKEDARLIEGFTMGVGWLMAADAR
ncbi:hypothetical protein KCU68_g75, partial [Aureobasidium melanogenum]